MRLRRKRPRCEDCDKLLYPVAVAQGAIICPGCALERLRAQFSDLPSDAHDAGSTMPKRGRDDKTFSERSDRVRAKAREAASYVVEESIAASIFLDEFRHAYATAQRDRIGRKDRT